VDDDFHMFTNRLLLYAASSFLLRIDDHTCPAPSFLVAQPFSCGTTYLTNEGGGGVALRKLKGVDSKL
jgi:hypothetical protein